MFVNTRFVRIEWGDCDPAGIVYYPRYLAFFDASTTALIERALGMTKHQYLKTYDFGGHPLVKTHAKIHRPDTVRRRRDDRNRRHGHPQIEL